MALFRLLAFLLVLFVVSPARAAGFEDWRDGDLVFQDSGGPQALAIRLATGSAYTHMGIVRLTAAGPVVIEAAARVGETPLARFLARGTDGRYAVYRVRGLTPDKARAVLAASRRYFGRPYDMFFRLEGDALYCSELPHHAFKAAGIALGRPERFGALAVDNAPVKALFAARWRQHPDCGATDAEGCWRLMQDQRLVTPAGIAADPQVEKLFSSF